MRAWHSDWASTPIGLPTLKVGSVKQSETPQAIPRTIPSPAPSLKGCMMKREFEVVIEKDRDGFYVGSVPSLRGCHTQAKSLDELMVRIKEVIELCLEVEQEPITNEFIGIQKVAVSA